MNSELLTNSGIVSVIALGGILIYAALMLFAPTSVWWRLILTVVFFILIGLVTAGLTLFILALVIPSS